MKSALSVFFVFGVFLLCGTEAQAQKGSFQEWWWRDVPTHKLPHSVNSPLQKQRAEESYQRMLKARAAKTQRRIAAAQESAARQATIANQSEKLKKSKLEARIDGLEKAIESLTSQLKAMQAPDALKQGPQLLTAPAR